MLLLRIANYISGSVRIKISGAVPEKFINLCMVRGIFLWGITKYNDDVFANMRLQDFFQIRPIARKSRNHIEVCSYRGLPFTMKRMKRRKMLLAGAVLFLILLQILSAHIWFIDVTGAKNIPAEKIRGIAWQQGLRPGVYKQNVDIRGIENQLLLNLPEAAWVGITVTGTRALIEVVEKTLPKPEDKSPANIVAAKDGIITEIIPIAGQAVVKAGDTVKKGDALIKGIITEPLPPGAAEPEKEIEVIGQPIRANGIIKARVWYEGYGEAGLVQEIKRRTGRQMTAVTLKVQDREFVLKQVSSQPFKVYEKEVIQKKLTGWRNSSFAVESTINVYHELSIDFQEITADEARDLAKRAALEAVQGMIPENAQVLARSSEVLKPAEPGLVRVKTTMETIEDIGQTVPIIQ